MDNKSNNITNESSINRIAQWIYSHDIAILTAYRDTFANATKNTLDDRPDELKKEDEKNGITDPSKKKPYTYTTSEKQDRNRDLDSTLLRLGYGVTKISGNYIENYKDDNEREVPDEASFFVVNLHDDPNFYNNIFKLSEYYNQNCFIYKPKNRDIAYSVGTNTANNPGYNRKKNVGKFRIDVVSQELSRYGNFNTRKNARINNQKNQTPITLDEWSKLQVMTKGGGIELQIVLYLISNNYELMLYTKNLKYAATMFLMCESFNQDLSNWNTKNLVYAEGMFDDCPIKDEFKPKIQNI